MERMSFVAGVSSGSSRCSLAQRMRRPPPTPVVALSRMQGYLSGIRLHDCSRRHGQLAGAADAGRPKHLEGKVDPIAEKLKRVEWFCAEQDPAAIAELTRRIAETGRRFSLISYSDLVRGIEFQFPTIGAGSPYRIDTYDWSGLDRRIVGDCLGYISMKSYLEAGFMASALVVARLESKPSDIFFEWMESLGVLPDLSERTVLAFWTQQVKKAHQWYKYGKST